MTSQVGNSNIDRTQMIAELVFDSFRDPMPFGVRSVSNMVRYLLFRAGSYVVEMRLEFVPGSQRYTVTGQVLNPDDDALKLDKVPVRLRSERTEIVRTLTNHFGEFTLEYETGRNVHICLEVSRQNDISIPLDESFWRMSALGI